MSFSDFDKSGTCIKFDICLSWFAFLNENSLFETMTLILLTRPPRFPRFARHHMQLKLIVPYPRVRSYEPVFTRTTSSHLAFSSVVSDFIKFSCSLLLRIATFNKYNQKEVRNYQVGSGIADRMQQK